MLVVVVPVLVDLRSKSAGVLLGTWAWLLACTRSELLTAAPITDCAGLSPASMGSHRVRLVSLESLIVHHRVDDGADRHACSSPLNEI
jgi:hypothetical protein